MNFFFKFLLLIIFLIIGGLTYMGIMPGLSSVFGTNKPKDLGITYTQQNFDQAKSNIKIAYEILPSNLTGPDSVVYEGKSEIDTALTGAEITALKNERKWKYDPLENTQIRFNDDGTTEVSASINKEKIFDYAASIGVSTGDIAKVREALAKIPVTPNIYVKGTFEITNNQVTNLNLSQVQIGKLSVPANIVSENQHYLGELAEMQFNKIPEFNAQSVKVEDSQLKFKGTIPAVEKIAE